MLTSGRPSGVAIRFAIASAGTNTSSLARDLGMARTSLAARVRDDVRTDDHTLDRIGTACGLEDGWWHHFWPRSDAMTPARLDVPPAWFSREWP